MYATRWDSTIRAKDGKIEIFGDVYLISQSQIKNYKLFCLDIVYMHERSDEYEHTVVSVSCGLVACQLCLQSDRAADWRYFRRPAVGHWPWSDGYILPGDPRNTADYNRIFAYY